MDYKQATLAFYRSIKSIPKEGSDDETASKGSFHEFGYCGMLPRPIGIFRE